MPLSSAITRSPGRNRGAGELYFDAMTGKRTTVSNGLLDNPTRVHRQAELLMLVDITRHAVDDAAGKPAVQCGKPDYAAVAVHIHATAMIDDKHVARVGGAHGL